MRYNASSTRDLCLEIKFGASGELGVLHFVPISNFGSFWCFLDQSTRILVQITSDFGSRIVTLQGAVQLVNSTKLSLELLVQHASGIKHSILNSRSEFFLPANECSWKALSVRPLSEALLSQEDSFADSVSNHNSAPFKTPLPHASYCFAESVPPYFDPPFSSFTVLPTHLLPPVSPSTFNVYEYSQISAVPENNSQISVSTDPALLEASGFCQEDFISDSRPGLSKLKKLPSQPLLFHAGFLPMSLMKKEQTFRNRLDEVNHFFPDSDAILVATPGKMFKTLQANSLPHTSATIVKALNFQAPLEIRNILPYALEYRLCKTSQLGINHSPSDDLRKVACGFIEAGASAMLHCVNWTGKGRHHRPPRSYASATSNLPSHYFYYLSFRLLYQDSGWSPQLCLNDPDPRMCLSEELPSISFHVRLAHGRSEDYSEHPAAARALLDAFSCSRPSRLSVMCCLSLTELRARTVQIFCHQLLANQTGIPLRYIFGREAADATATVSSGVQESMSVVVKIFEHQSYYTFQQEWKACNLSSDGVANFTDFYLTSLEKSELLPFGWRWEGAWSLVIDQSVDSEGWCYAYSHSKDSKDESNFTSANFLMAAARRRRWWRVRTRIPADANEMFIHTFEPPSKALILELDAVGVTILNTHLLHDCESRVSSVESKLEEDQLRNRKGKQPISVALDQDGSICSETIWFTPHKAAIETVSVIDAPRGIGQWRKRYELVLEMTLLPSVFVESPSPSPSTRTSENLVMRLSYFRSIIQSCVLRPRFLIYNRLPCRIAVRQYAVSEKSAPDNFLVLQQQTLEDSSENAGGIAWWWPDDRAIAFVQFQVLTPDSPMPHDVMAWSNPIQLDNEGDTGLHATLNDSITVRLMVSIRQVSGSFHVSVRAPPEQPFHRIDNFSNISLTFAPTCPIEPSSPIPAPILLPACSSMPISWPTQPAESRHLHLIFTCALIRPAASPHSNPLPVVFTLESTNNSLNNRSRGSKTELKRRLSVQVDPDLIGFNSSLSVRPSRWEKAIVTYNISVTADNETKIVEIKEVVHNSSYEFSCEVHSTSANSSLTVSSPSNPQVQSDLEQYLAYCSLKLVQVSPCLARKQRNSAHSSKRSKRNEPNSVSSIQSLGIGKFSFQANLPLIALALVDDDENETFTICNAQIQGVELQVLVETENKLRAQIGSVQVDYPASSSVVFWSTNLEKTQPAIQMQFTVPHVQSSRCVVMLFFLTS